MKIKIIEQSYDIFSTNQYKTFENKINNAIDEIENELLLEVFNAELNFNKDKMIGVIYYGQPEEKY
ncbi:hypothetical protein [Streptococcus mutans]|uniref:hypothetical protein n=1 Tax=Streptococcus mutans TaxID=1309 RepID=UPI0002B5C134|nr:hypothetical protein [Streptococcus mutans]EMC43540.1 hypothetical protein SMU99_07515 [Streptococcus mutans 24]